MTWDSLLQELLQAGLIVAGYDSKGGGQVYALPLGGTLVQAPFSIGEVHLQSSLDCQSEQATRVTTLEST
jgi:hypothetical protein